MRPKLSKEEELRRKAIIDAGIALVGKTVFEYMGEPPDHKAWRQQQAKKRLGNKTKDETTRGIGAGSAGAKHVAKETA